MQHVVSIITPTFNRAHLLPRLWHSISGQSFKEFEWIVVDDGSTDSTRGYINNIDDDRVVYCWQENKGVNFARNKGIEICNALYSVFIDSDDAFYNRTTLENMVREIRKAPEHVHAVAFKTVDQNLSDTTSYIDTSPLLANYYDIICKNRIRGEFIYIFKNQVFEKVRWPSFNGLDGTLIWNIAKFSPVLYLDMIGRIYYTNKPNRHKQSCDNLSGAYQTIQRSKSMAVGIEDVIKVHGRAMGMYCPRQLGIKHFYAAFYHALYGNTGKALFHLRKSLTKRGPLLKIIFLCLSLIMPIETRRYIFILKSRYKM